MRHDARLGHRFIENVRARIAHERGAYYVHTNAQGFRDDEDFGPKGMAFRIAFYGDSFTAGDGVSNSERFTAHVGVELGVDALNLAVSGHGPDQSALLLEETPVPDADLVVFCIAANTIDRIQRDRRIAMDRQGRHVSAARPHFVIESDGLQLRGVPVTDQVEVLREANLQGVEPPYQARLNLLKGAIRRQLSPLARRMLPWDAPSEYDDPDGGGWRLMAAIVEHFHRLAGGVPVAIVPLPTRELLIRGRTTAFQRRFESLERAAEGLYVLNVVDRMLAKPAPERSGLTFTYDAHPSAQGHTAIAEGLCAELKARDLVPGSAAQAPARTPGTTSASPQTKPQVASTLSLDVRWDHRDSGARILDGEGRPRTEFIDESTLTGSFGCIGALPLSAIHEVLEREALIGSELASIRLLSPASVQDLAALDLTQELWVLTLAPCVRWHGAAAMDLRALLRYGGDIRHVTQDGPVEEPLAAALAQQQSTTEEPDAELLWLSNRLQRLWNHRGSPGIVSRILRLARQWELATRRARDAVSPTAAPGRRARLRMEREA